MKKDYQKLWSLTNKEYIYLLESYYFENIDRFKKIKQGKGLGYVAIPDIPPYVLWFNDGKRISSKNAKKIIHDNNNVPQSY
ncbi:hypothetical protein [Parabacteroides gordonii]|uniref:hypothetical protein n=1 Tax=Parabacteroides gordonii TaxID=574930 RepID=UPI0026ED580E|nr:hypothetical protein [Parabacteroides gordonii]